MEFAAFAEHARAIEERDADLAVVAAVADLFTGADDDLSTIARFVQGRVFPAWDDRNLAVGPAMCHEALARAAAPDVDAGDVEDRLADVGDIGAVAQSLDLGGQQGLAAFANDDPQALDVEDVYAEFEAMAASTGSGSDRARADRLFGLFNRATPVEARYLARLVLEEMRIGVGEGSVRDAIAGAFVDDDWPTGDGTGTDGADGVSPATGEDGESSENESDDHGGQLTLAAIGQESTGDDADSTVPENGAPDDGPDEDEESDSEDSAGTESRPSDHAVAVVERALQVTNDYGRVAVVARREGAAGLESLSLELGRPVQAMLAQAGQVTDTIDDWDGVAVETKYDGARVQIHHDPDGETHLYSRNMANVTDALPEIVEFVRARVDVPVILDGEVIAIDDGEVLPFQRVLERFRRKHDVAQAREGVPVELRAFDCLHWDGRDLLDAPLSERREYLEHALEDGLATYAVMYDPEKIDEFEAAVLDAGHEGIMLKDPDSTYTAGRRGREWLKRKPDVETLDLVVTGAQWGEGRRSNVYGTFEVAARRGTRDAGSHTADAVDEDLHAEYGTIGHVATGITDAELESLTDRLREHVAREDGQTLTFEPAVVFEVGYEEIQRSPSTESGYALRFPRFVAVREDKDPEDADDLDRIEGLATD